MIKEDTLNGDNGDDRMAGNAGFDLMYGGDGDDTLDGGAQADNIFGGYGDDIGIGSFGIDRLFGGGGNVTAFMAALVKMSCLAAMARTRWRAGLAMTR